MFITKKKAALLFSYIAAAFLILTGFLIKSRYETDFFKYQNDVKLQHAFSELVNGVVEVDASLQKSLYATTPSMISSTCTDVYGKALVAKMSLSELPFAKYSLEETSGFLAKVGDYAYLLSRNSSNGKGYSEEEYKNLTVLAEIAALLSQNLLSIQADINEGKMTFQELSSSSLNRAEENVIPASLGESFQLIEAEFPEVPTLIYDGPFSQHISARKPKLLEGLEEIDSDTALQAAAKYMGLKPNIFTPAGEYQCDIPLYCFTADVDGGEMSVCVTKKGGKLFSMLNSRDVPEASLSSKEAIEAAVEFLYKNGFSSMKESYWSLNGNVMTINFCYEQDGVLFYPDLVKVSVALDNGRIVGFEGKGYIMNHEERRIPEAKISRDEAKTKVAKSLSVFSHAMAVIPTPGQNEVFCHEFKCENGDGNRFIVYVNALTGDEEDVLILIEDENGTLTM
jgi:germination protein YpeB